MRFIDLTRKIARWTCSSVRGSNEPSKPIRIKKMHSHLIIKNVGTVLKYHTVGTVPKYHTVGTVPKYHTVGTVLKYHAVGTVIKYNCRNSSEMPPFQYQME